MRYFKEYYLLKDKYQRIAQNSVGFGLVSGFFLYWIGWGNLLGLFIERTPFGQPRTFSAWESFLVFIGLPLSLWTGVIGISLLHAAMGKISIQDALLLSVKFFYPRHWLKTTNDTPTTNSN